MRRFVNRLWLRTATAVTVSFPLLLAGCDKLQPAGGNPTMTLLRDGSEKLCIAADIQQALRELIVPKAAEVWPNTPLETRAAGAKGVSLGYTLTTLQSFDKAVAKAVCNSTVTVRGATDERRTTSGDQLHLVGGQSFDATGTITQADAISFQMTLTEGGSWSLRRCTREETEALPQPTTDGNTEQ